jgi:hypothetical protein
MGELGDLKDELVRLYGLERIHGDVPWVTEFFKREEVYIRSVGAPAYDRPLGTMHKKRSGREGYAGAGIALAYARWDKRDLSPAGLGVILSRYRDQYDPESFEAFLDEQNPRRPYERLAIITSRALYSGAGRDRLIRRFGFDGSFRAGMGLETRIEADLLASQLPVPLEFRAPYLADEPTETMIDKPPFTLFGLTVRARSLSR